jgi:hypothetical protein
LLVPVLEPEPMLPLLDPPVLAPPLVDAPLLGVLLEVPPALLEDEPSSFRQLSFSAPISESQRDAPVLAPVDEEPLAPVDGELELPPVVAAGELVLLPVPLAPVLLEPAELCANAPEVANSAAAVAETMSFRFICAP